MYTKEQAEEYRKHPIYGTDFSKRLSELLKDIRSNLLRTRGYAYDLERGFPEFKDRIDYISGYLTSGIISIYSSIQEIQNIEIKMDNHKFGKSLKFVSRGIGLDICPCCFVCDATCRSVDIAHNPYLNNIAAYVASKEEGLEIVKWFKDKARLDYRDNEPDYIQVKVGACDKHFPNLQRLHYITTRYNLIREVDIQETIKWEEKFESSNK